MALQLSRYQLHAVVGKSDGYLMAIKKVLNGTATEILAMRFERFEGSVSAVYCDGSNIIMSSVALTKASLI